MVETFKLPKNAYAELMGVRRDEEAFFSALGKLIAEYALAETAVHLLARKLSGLPNEKARIMFGGMRLGDLSDRIRGFMRVDKTEKDKFSEIDRCLTQLDLISDQRNKFVHRFVSYKNERLCVTNVLTAKTRDGIEQDIFDVHDLNDMVFDCGRIYLTLTSIHDAKWRMSQTPDILSFLLHGPWRYRPDELDPQKKPRQKVPGSQKRPPRA